MRSRAAGLLLASLAALGALGGCAPRVLLPVPLAERREAGPLRAALDEYNSGPQAVRAWGTLKGDGPGRADFGATVVPGTGLRFDAVAGPFSAPLFALACRSGVECQGYWPSRGRVYVDEGGRWERFLAAALRGRVPALVQPVSESGWQSEQGSPVLVLEGGDGWQQRVEFSAGGGRPERVLVGRAGRRPDAALRYEAYGPDVEGKPFPGRLRLNLAEPEREVEITFVRVEPAPAVDPSLFVLSVPPGTAEERVRGTPTWHETAVPFWPSPPKGQHPPR